MDAQLITRNSAIQHNTSSHIVDNLESRSIGQRE